MKIGQKIKDCRLKRNLTQAQLAEMVGKDISTISKIETDSANPSWITLNELAKALRVPLAELLEEQVV